MAREKVARYEVVEDAESPRQRTVHRAADWLSAMLYAADRYSIAEIGERNVDVHVVMSTGRRFHAPAGGI